MKKLNRFLSLLLAVCLLLSMVPNTVLAVTRGTADPSYNTAFSAIQSSGDRKIQAIKSPLADYVNALKENNPTAATAAAVQIREILGMDVDLKQALALSGYENLEELIYDENEMVRVIVVLEEKGLLARGFTTEQIAGAVYTQAAVKTISSQQDAVMAKIAAAAGGKNRVTEKYRYNVAVSGLAVVVPYGSLEAIRQIKGVKTAFVAPSYAVPEDMTAADAQPHTGAATGQSGVTQTWQELGLNGEGMRIAIIDTGLDLDHPSFVDAPVLTDTSLTLAEVESVLTSLNAYELYGSALTAEALYRSEKVPFGFNYVDRSLDVTHDNDMIIDHGTHVAGIAAANDIATTDVVGVAPEAQLLVMKVFGLNGGAYFDDILAAVEDSFRLNVDALNLSLGSPAGFSSEGEVIDEIFSQILNSDMITSISAGNDYSFGYGTNYGTDRNLTCDPDIGLVGSPGTYLGATTVASLENVQTRLNYFTVDDIKIGYNDVSVYSIVLNYGGETFEYVMVPGIGDVSDYEGLDVEGKVAVVQRGGLDFVTKQTNAYNAGAAICIVYDNVDGLLVNMLDAGLLPNAFISKADGAILAEAAGEDGVGTLSLADAYDMLPVTNPLSGYMSDFSSIGVTPDLRLEPDITAYGGNIYSCLTDGQYGIMSGTSMAAPAVAGMSALLLQYLREAYPELTDAQKHTITEALLMSTAAPVVDPENPAIHYTPRKQGAGNANIYNAITSPAYLTVNGSTPKVSLGDDDSRTGVYTFEFEVNNLSDKDLTFTVDGYAMTDQVNLVYEDRGMLLMGETGRKLDAPVTFSVDVGDLSADYDLNEDGKVNREDVQLLLDMVNGVAEVSQRAESLFDLDEDGSLNTVDAQILYELVQSCQMQVHEIQVGAGETVTVTATIVLTDADKEYMDTYYENGIYVEGFVMLTAVTEGALDLSLPYVGFYGNWSDARMFDTGWWYQDGETMDYQRYPHVAFTQFGGEDYGYNLGLNPYIEEEYNPYHNVLSPNGDGYVDYIGDFYIGLMRNGRKLDFTWDIYDENGQFVESIVQTMEYARKSSYYSNYGLCIPFAYKDYHENANEITANLPEGYRVELTIEGYLDDGDDVVDETLMMPVGDEYYTSIPIYIDNTAPTIIDEHIEYKYNEEDDSRCIEFYVEDNHAIATVALLTEAGRVIEFIPVEDSDEPTLISVDVSGYDSTFYVAVCDYGANESYYEITFSGEYNADFNKFYGYRREAIIPYGDYLYTTDTMNGWYSFETADSMLQHTDQYSSGEAAVSAADYVDGYILGVDVNSNIFAIKSGEWSRAFLGTLEIDGELCTALDMAFDHKNNVMYIITDELNAATGSHLIRMNYLTGEYEDLGVLQDADWEFSKGVTLACDNDGILYTIDAKTGDLYTVDPSTSDGDNVLATYVGSTGHMPEGYQSMTVDHETNELYWAAHQDAYGDSNFYRVDKTTGELTWLADMEYDNAMTGLFKPYKSDAQMFPDNVEVTALQLTETSLCLAVGFDVQMMCKQLPYYAQQLEVTWVSSDETVVTVEDGYVLAVGPGKAVITVSAGDLYAECTVEVFEFTEELYAYDMGTTGLWVSFPAADPSDATFYEDAVPSLSGFTAAAYHDGWVYAGEYDGSFYRLDPETLTGSKIGNSGGTLMGMAFNYTDGFMYAVRMLTGAWGEQTFELVRVNLSTGAVRVVQALDSYTYGTALCSLAIDLEGNFYFYTANYSAYEPQLIRCVLTDDGMGTEQLEIQANISMSRYPNYGFGALHYSMGTGGLYLTTDTGTLFWVNIATMDDGYVQAVELGVVGYASGWPQILGIYSIPETEPEAPHAEPEQVTLPDSYLVLAGGSVSANLAVEPWNAVVEPVFSTADPEIATVDEFGVITGVAPGKTTLTVTVAQMGYSKTVDVTVAESTGNVYGYLVSDFAYESNAWISFEDFNPMDAYTTAVGDDSIHVFAGAYYDGTIYGVGKAQNSSLGYKNYFVKVDADDHSVEILASVSATVRDMAFDYTTGTLYGIAEGGFYTGAVVQFDAATGEMTVVADTNKVFAAMTVDGSGQMYGICQTDDCLYRIDKITGETTLVGSTGVDAGMLYQSMTWDPETGNLYWAQAADDQTSALRLIDMQTGMSASLGTVGTYGAVVSCLYTETENEPEVPKTVRSNGVRMAEKLFVVTGTTAVLDATVLPVSVATVKQTLKWNSSDPSVATVVNGVVTGVSAGTAIITATNIGGYSASCEVTVSDVERSFFAYDRTNTRWIGFAGNDTTNVSVVRDDAEGETPLRAAAYTGTVVYAYDEDGVFYAVDPETFERTRLGDGIYGQILEVETTDCTLSIIDMSYDETTGQLYAALQARNASGENEGYLIGLVDLTSGTVTSLFHTKELRLCNLLVCNGKAVLVDGYSSMVTSVNLTEEEPTVMQQAQIGDYWGDREASSSIIWDPYTGTVYVVRDTVDTWSDLWEKRHHGEAILYTLNLGDGTLVPTTKGGAYIGNGIMVCGLFLK